MKVYKLSLAFFMSSFICCIRRLALLLLFMFCLNNYLFSIGCVQFIKELAQQFQMKTDIDININIEIDDSCFASTKSNILHAISAQQTMPATMFIGLCLFEIACLCEDDAPTDAIECFRLAAKFGIPKAKVKFAELVFQRFPGHFKNFEEEAIGYIISDVDAYLENKIVFHPVFAINMLKILGGYYVNNDIKKTIEYFSMALKLIDEQIKSDTYSHTEKSSLSAEKEQINRFIKNASEF